MQQSLYFQYTEKYFPLLVLSIVEKLNEKRQQSLPYLYKDMLTPQYSSDGMWASVLAQYTRVAADVVALDAELPLKSLDTIEVAHGEIPKLGMKLYLTEKQMKDIENMIAKQMPIQQIIGKIFVNLRRCIEGIFERLEDMFLSELSTGVGLSSRNAGTGVRVTVGYLDANQFVAKAKTWADNADALAVDDIEQIFDKALEDQNTITDVFTDDFALRALYKNTQFKQLFAFNQNFVGSNIPNLDFDQLSAVFLRKWGVTLHRVNRSIKTEVNGIKKNHKPWAEGRLVFTCDAVVGDLVYTNTAEQSHPVAGVTYSTVEGYILCSQYSKNDPLREFTSSQAMAVPVVHNVDQIYTLDPKTVEG